MVKIGREISVIGEETSKSFGLSSSEIIVQKESPVMVTNEFLQILMEGKNRNGDRRISVSEFLGVFLFNVSKKTRISIWNLFWSFRVRRNYFHFVRQCDLI